MKAFGQKNPSNQSEKKHGLIVFFLNFYRRFSIPWWLFLLQTGLGVANTEISLQLAEMLIRVNKGELYNSVILMYALVYVGNAILVWVMNLFYSYGSEKVVLRARTVLFRHILHLPVGKIVEEEPSSLISAVVNDSTNASTTIGYLFLLVNALYSFVRACTVLFRYNATLSMYMLLLIPVAVIVFWGVGKMQSLGMRVQRVALNDMTIYFAEHILAAKYVKASSMEKEEVSAGFSSIEKGYRAGVLYAFLAAAQSLMYSIQTSMSTILIAIFGSNLIRGGKMEQTGITNFSTYMDKVNEYVSLILTDYQAFQGARATLGRVGQLLDSPVERPEDGDSWKENANEKDIVFDRVTFGYDRERDILHDLSFRIPAGKTTAIIGNNGCGKSTVMKLMQGLYLPNEGSVRVAGNEVGKTALKEIRARFSYVLQSSEIFEGTLRENMAYGAGEVSKEQLVKVGEQVCLKELADSLPQGYDSPVGENGGQLSGGQRQRIAIARALLRKPEYLLLDEAGSALDYQTYEQIQNSIQEEMEGRTTVFIAHNVQEMERADYIIVLNRGRLEAAGEFDELSESCETFRRYLRESLGKTEHSKEGEPV